MKRNTLNYKTYNIILIEYIQRDSNDKSHIVKSSFVEKLSYIYNAMSQFPEEYMYMLLYLTNFQPKFPLC